MRSRKRRLAAIALVLVLGVLAALAPIRPANAASKVRLSKTSLTFKSDKAKAQTITVKGIKKSNIKEMTIQNYAETYISVKQKGKNKIVVKPLRSSDDITSPIYVTVEFKKPIKGDYRAYLSVEKLKVKGKSKIAVKTADELASLLPHCTRNRWTYYLANDIDMTGRGFINYSYADLNIDGKGHKIISDGPVFGEFSGKMKNVIFECNYDIAPSKNSIVNELLSSYKEIAPVLQLETGSTMTGCKST
ncbi:MAG: hypothetical protein J6Z46_06695, partial [Lachnospiraceae bacterium]|nr:hypothetical protein [Lachnospiraceae bacterium]